MTASQYIKQVEKIIAEHRRAYIKQIERIIAEHQRVQMVNPHTSQAWQDASAEINRLAALIVKEGKR